jgi:tetratricopeptide (TPR) repeat protein
VGHIRATVNGAFKRKIQMHLFICFLIVLGGLLLVTRCEANPNDPVIIFKADFNTKRKPQLSLFEASENIKRMVQKIDYVDGSTSEDFRMTGDGFTFKNHGVEYKLFRYSEIQNLTEYQDSSDYFVGWRPDYSFCWKSKNDAQIFMDAVQAMKYYVLNQYLVDETKAFADFQEKAKAWQALPQKPRLPEEARRFRVLADDAVQNKNFDKAANYYEQGIAIDPMWPAGHYNAAMIYKELNFYPMAVMHMKRYLVLKPEDTKKYQDQIYIWEEKAKEDNS